MSTVLKQYLKQNPQNPLNERKSPLKTLPAVQNLYILPSKMQTSQYDIKGNKKHAYYINYIFKNTPIYDLGW